MSSSDPPRPAKKSVPLLAVLIGLAVLPLTAAAAFAVGVSGSDEETTASTVTSVVAAAETQTDVAARDMAAACGPAGRRLVRGERRGSLTDVQQAALDSLREICAENGYTLPAPKQAQPSTPTVVVAESTPTTTVPAPSTSTTWDDDDHDDDDWDDDHDDDDDDDDDDWDDDHDDDDWDDD